MKNDQAPSLIIPIKSFVVRQQEGIHRELASHFSPCDGSLEFELLLAPSWLSLEQKTGTLTGIAPMVVRSAQSLVIIKVSNACGSVTESFLLKVVDHDFIDAITRPLLHLTPAQDHEHYHLHHARTTHEILRYLYEYYRQSKEWKIFTGILQEQASKLNIHVSNPLRYEDFRRLALALNPNIESDLGALAQDEYHLLLDAELDNDEMQRLFRQGSQPQGVHARQVFNYIGAPSLMNIAATHTVLRAAVDAVIYLHHQADRDDLRQHHAPTLSLGLRPTKDWSK